MYAIRSYYGLNIFLRKIKANMNAESEAITEFCEERVETTPNIIVLNIANLLIQDNKTLNFSFSL